MLRIHGTQRDALAATMADSFPARLRAFVRRELPGADVAAIAPAIARADALGVRGEHDVATYVVLAAIHGPGFEREPWVAAILAAPGLAISERVQRVYDATIRRVATADTPLGGRP